MRNKLAITLIGLFTCLSGLFSAIKVTGVIKSKENEAVPFANIALIQHEHLITGTISNEKGYFVLTIDTKDEYILSISHILYAPQKVDLMVSDTDIDLGTIEVTTDSQTLDEINVVASDVIQKADRDVIVLNKKYTRQTTDAEQLLQKLPSVSMDLISQNFKVANRENVLLQVDGLVKSEQYIRSIPPANIVKVEIIKEVSGRFANEYDAIINIITNKSMHGYNVSGKEFSAINLDDKDNTVIINVAKLNYSYFNSKMSLYGGYSNFINKFKIPNHKKYDYNDNFSVVQISGTDDNDFSILEHDFFVGTDIRLGEHKVLSAEFKYSLSPENNNKQTSQQNVATFQGDALTNQYTINNSSASKTNNPYAQISYAGNIGDKNKVNAGVCYYSTQNETSGTLNVNNNFRYEDADIQKDYVDFYLENNWELNKSINLDFNYDFRYQNTRSSYTINQVATPENTNAMIKHNAGIYLNYIISDNSQLKIGSAMESIQLDNESASVKKSDNQLVALPFLSYSKKLSKVLNFKLNYKVNTQNPSLSQLSPFTSMVDSFTTSTGNPLLKPSYYHEVKGTFDLANGGIVIQPFYKFGNDVQTKTGSVTNDHVVSYRYDNALDYKNYGFDLMGSLFQDLKNKDQIYLSVDVQKYWENAQFATQKHHLTDWKISSQLAYLANKYNTMLAIVLQKSNAKKITAQGYINNSNDYLALYVKKGFFKSRIEFGCTYITPYKDGFITTKNNIEHGENFNRVDIGDLSVVQNTFIFDIKFNLNKNSDKMISQSKKKKRDNDKIQNGIL